MQLSYLKIPLSPMWWCMPIIPALRRRWQKEREFEANLSYVVSEKEGLGKVAKSACLVCSRSWVCSTSLGGGDNRGRALTLEQRTSLCTYTHP